MRKNRDSRFFYIKVDRIKFLSVAKSMVINASISSLSLTLSPDFIRKNVGLSHSTNISSYKAHYVFLFSLTSNTIAYRGKLRVIRQATTFGTDPKPRYHSRHGGLQ